MKVDSNLHLDALINIRILERSLAEVLSKESGDGSVLLYSHQWESPPLNPKPQTLNPKTLKP